MSGTWCGFSWIDGVCINQLDTQERGHQVALMGSIYTHATSVIVWLGRSDPELEKFHFLHMLLCPALGGLIQREGLEKVCTVYLEDSTILEQLGFSADIAAQLSIPPPSLEHWKAYAKFYERRFFQRAWIVQELALARGIAVLCGEIELDWTAMIMIQYFVVKSQWGSYLSSAYRITSNDGTPGGKQAWR